MTQKNIFSDETARLQMMVVGLAVAVAALVAYIVLSKPGEPPAPPAPQETAPPAAARPRSRIVLSAAAQQEAGIQLTVLSPRTERSTIQANGQLVLNENETWHVGSLVEGKVTEVRANAGDRVRKGQVLALVHSHAVHETRAAYAQALAELDRAKAARELARRSAARADRLFRLQAVSQEQVDSANNDLRAAETGVEKAAADVEKERRHLIEFLEVNPDTPHAAAESPEADSVPIKAPSSGTVIRRLVSSGSVLSVGQEAYTISNLSSLWLIAAVNEADLAAVHPGVAARISVRAYPNRTFAGRVLQLGEEMDPATRSLKVRIAVASPSEELKPEMFAQVEIDGAGGRPAIHLPETSLEDIDGERVVFVQTSADSFEPRTVKTAPATAGLVEVVSGVTAGEKVVTKGAFILKSEMLKSRLQGD